MGYAVKGFKGLLGGSFNPIHHGHLHLALEVKERCALSEVCLVPAHVSPFKEDVIEKEHRYEMVRLAIEGIRGLTISDNEVGRPPPSYTIDTVRFFVGEGEKIALIVADDLLVDIDRWKESRALLSEVPLIVGRRGGHCPQKFERALIQMPILDISSTYVRERLKKRLPCQHLVPPKPLDYIYENQLYSTP